MIVTDDQASESNQYIADHASEAGALKGKLNAYDYQLKVREAEGMKASEGGAEIRRMNARSGSEYKKLVQKISEAQERYHDLQAQINFHYARLDCWRTECANRRGLR